LTSIITLLADDAIGATRESPTNRTPYEEAFKAIGSDPNQVLAVGEADGEVVATLQLTFIPGMSRNGMWRAQIESVRVASSRRGDGFGEAMVQWAIESARARNCGLVQLTTDARRDAAHRFYERLGFVASHIGFKLDLAPSV
jgi:ribosomal protein S18 acetylase RimI-like enzyme